jgi:hypothetical protein
MAEQADSPLSVEQVLRDEAKAIHFLDKHAAEALDKKAGNDLNRALNDLGSCAMCMSGGGIRSASFALGVIQALAVHPRSGGGRVGSADKSLLARFHYLSTVSGRSYIVSWLPSWRLHGQLAPIWRSLGRRPEAPVTQPLPIAWLIRSAIISADDRTLSADTWARPLWVRNLVLNWLLIHPPICAAIILLKLIGLASNWVILFWMTPAWDKRPMVVLRQAALRRGGRGWVRRAGLRVDPDYAGPAQLQGDSGRPVR